jgi:hypothetical protein
MLSIVHNRLPGTFHSATESAAAVGALTLRLQTCPPSHSLTDPCWRNTPQLPLPLQLLPPLQQQLPQRQLLLAVQLLHQAGTWEADSTGVRRRYSAAAAAAAQRPVPAVSISKQSGTDDHVQGRVLNRTSLALQQQLVITLPQAHCTQQVHPASCCHTVTGLGTHQPSHPVTPCHN